MGCTVGKLAVLPIARCSELVRIEAATISCLGIEEWKVLVSKQASDFKERNRDPDPNRSDVIKGPESKPNAKWRGQKEDLHYAMQGVFVRKPQKDAGTTKAAFMGGGAEMSGEDIEKKIFKANLRKSFIINPKTFLKKGSDLGSDSNKLPSENNDCLPVSIVRGNLGSCSKLDSREEEQPLRSRHRSNDFKIVAMGHNNTHRKEKRHSIFFRASLPAEKESKQERSPGTKVSQFSPNTMKDFEDRSQRGKGFVLKTISST